MFTTTGSIIVGLYFISSVFRQELFCNLLSGMNSALATVIFLYSYSITDKKQTTGKALLLFALACLSWFVGGVIWQTISIFGGNPLKSALVNTMYTFTNIFLGFAVVFFAYYQFKRWNSVQLLLDTMAITVMSGLLIWIVFFHKDNAWSALLFQDGCRSAISIAFDFIVIIGLLITRYSIRGGKLPFSLLLVGAGLLLYSLTDLYYYYVFLHNQYIPNSLLDAVFVAVLMLMALGNLRRVIKDTDMHLDTKDEMGIGQSLLILLLFPAAAILSEGFVISDLIYFAVIMLMYKTSSDQVRLAIEKDNMYRMEKEINITLEKRVEEQYGELVFLANHDTLTRLYNRRHFLKSLEEVIGRIQPGELLAVIMIDLDRFKTINDTLGHDIGDKVLIEISNRMNACSETRAILARLGGDEFALFVRGQSHAMIAAIAQDIIKTCYDPILIAGNKLQVTMSLGIALYPGDADSRVDLLRNADIAMYRAKAQGCNRFVFYDPFFNESAGKKDEIEALLQKANIEKDFELLYQPQFDLSSNRLIGAEALLRWKSAEHGYILPYEFIPVAEEINDMIRIGKWVMGEAIGQIIDWNTRHSLELRMGINISPKQLKDDGFIGMIKNLTGQEGFKSAWLDAEITENTLHECDDRTASILADLKELSVSMSIDDYGSGNSCIGGLSQYTFDRIKIDKSLVDQLLRDNDSGIQTVKGIVDMGDAMGIDVIAEGVETKEQMEILMDLKCKQAQGYWLGRPVNAADFEKLFIGSRICMALAQ